MVRFLWRHFLTCPRNVWTYFNATYHNYLLLGPHVNDDIFKVVGLKITVTDSIFRKCTHLAEAPIDGSLSSSFYRAAWNADAVLR